MYVFSPTKGVFKSKKYRTWIETNLPLIQADMRPAEVFPVDIDIVIVQGRDWGPHCDPDNANKPIMDLMVRAGVLPDDSGKYVNKVHVRYMPFTSRGEAVTRIAYAEPDPEPELET